MFNELADVRIHVESELQWVVEKLLREPVFENEFHVGQCAAALELLEMFGVRPERAFIEAVLMAHTDDDDECGCRTTAACLRHDTSPREIAVWLRFNAYVDFSEPSIVAALASLDVTAKPDPADGYDDWVAPAAEPAPPTVSRTQPAPRRLPSGDAGGEVLRILRDARREMTSAEVGSMTANGLSGRQVGQVMRRLSEKRLVARVQYTDPNTGWVSTYWVHADWTGEDDEDDPVEL